MGYEIGGRADKFGNRYEYNWAIIKLIELCEEKISSVTLEAIGKDEEGIDIWIENKDGTREGQQCKGRCGSDENWKFSTAKEKGIWSNWKKQLDRSYSIHVSLISPLAFTKLEDTIMRAKNSNGNSNDFINIQIENSSNGIKNLFKNICKEMDLNLENDDDRNLVLNYFQRMHYRQCPDSTLKKILIGKIEYLFFGESETIYNTFLDYIINGNIYGKQITLPILNHYLKQKGIFYKNLATNPNISPKIQDINEEYKKSYSTFSKGLIHRNITDKLWKQIQNGESIIVHGKAGVGKSGCSAEIVNLCEENAIPYIAIKLDKHIPKSNPEIWANELGLPTSISYCLDAISKESHAVIILDQLDALRWTQAHSRDSLSVCMRIINEVKLINIERSHKISMVFISRTYDLKNDSSIKQLFDAQNKNDIKWNELEIGELDDETLKLLIGDDYFSYPNKIKKLLKISSNLYIWERLDKKEDCLSIEATYQLVTKWWEQISNNARENNLDTMCIEDIKNKFVEYCDKRGCISLPCTIISIPGEYNSFLISSGFMIQSGSTLSFVHQSILDCFLSEQMLKKHFHGMNIIDILGDKAKQTPGKRYQTQIFLQQLYEWSIDDFIEAGNLLLENKNIRYSFKYIFIELLSQIKEHNDAIWELVKNLLENQKWKNSIISTVIIGNITNVHNARDCGLLDKWIVEDYNLVIDIMYSIAPNYDNLDLKFIRKYAIEGTGNTNWWHCFYKDINAGSDEYFELRLEFYKKFPDEPNMYIDLKNMFKTCEIRTIRMLLLFFEINEKHRKKTVSQYVEDFIDDDTDIIVNNYKEVLKYLLPVLPKIEIDTRFSNWSNRNKFSDTFERVIIKIIKLANRKYAKYEPENFWNTYSCYMGTGNKLYNELLLDGCYYLPDDYADKVIKYLYSDFEKNATEDTSGNGNELLLTAHLIKRFSKLCQDTTYKTLENRIIKYFDTNSKDTLTSRIEENRDSRKNGYHVYWRFWGDFQRMILPFLDEKRRSKEANELIKVLNNRDKDITNIYDYEHDLKTHDVISPVSDKILSYNNWLKIITNPKIKNMHRKIRFENNTYIESSFKNFIYSFQNYISQESMDIIFKKFVNSNIEFDSEYVNSLFYGISQNSQLNDVSNQEIEYLIFKYGYDMLSDRAGTICEIIEKMHDTKWSNDIFNLLIDIALHHENSSINNVEEKNLNIFDLETNALNCVRGKAILAIGHLLWDCNKYTFDFFKSTLEILSSDDSQVIKYSLLWALWPSYNIEKEWAVKIIMKLFKENSVFLGFRDSRFILCNYYNDYKNDINNSIILGINSNDERLNRECGYAIAELHMKFDAYSDILSIYESVNKTVKRSILEMIIVYVSVDKHRKKAISLLNKMIELENDKDIAFIWSKLLRRDLIKYPEDKILIKKILMSKINKHLLDVFYDYLSRNGGIINFADIIIDMSYAIINEETKQDNYVWRLDTKISRLIIGLYDEATSNKTSKYKDIANKCLDIWDLMYEKNLGIARTLANQIMNI